jgi:ubiquinone/menaquinone biosynthesis C-methylase UbiE
MAEINRIVWEKGNFGVVARHIWNVGASIVDHAGVSVGEDVLDVACGTGNAALRAAARGARVTGLDIVPALLDQGRELARDADLDLEFVEGDAEAMPFADASFDVVLSTFGCMFVPDHRLAALEIARVLRPGGRIGIAAWTPEGTTGEMFRVTASHMPPPPDGFEPPVLWGTEDHVREIFAGTGVEPEFTREKVMMEYESPEQTMTEFETYFGPVVMARETMEPQGTWQALRDEMLEFFRRLEASGEGAEYLVVTGTKAAG